MDDKKDECVCPFPYRIRRDPDWSTRWAAFDEHGDCVAHIVAGTVASQPVPHKVIEALLHAERTGETPAHADR